MQFKYFYSFFKTFKIPGLFSVFSDFKGMVRYHFLYAAIESGLLEALKIPCSRDNLINKLGVKDLDILDALLKVGISLKEVNCKNDLYGIRGKGRKPWSEHMGIPCRQLFRPMSPITTIHTAMPPPG